MQFPVVSALLPSGCLGPSVAGEMGPTAVATGLWLLQGAPQLKKLPLGADQCVLVQHQPGLASLVPNYRIEDLNLENLSHLHMQCISHDPGCLGACPVCRTCPPVLRQDCLSGIQGEEAESLSVLKGDLTGCCIIAVDLHLLGVARLFCGLSHLKKILQ